MSVQIKSLTIGAPQQDTSLPAPNDSFNVIPTANVVFDLYVALNDTTNKVFKSAIIKSIRVLNISTSATVKVTLYFNRPTVPIPPITVGQYRRRQLTPADMPLPPGFEYIDDDEITLEPGDKIQAKADTAGVIQYLLSGMERDA